MSMNSSALGGFRRRGSLRRTSNPKALLSQARRKSASMSTALLGWNGPSTACKASVDVELSRRRVHRIWMMACRCVSSESL